ncbi:TORTIFOLIA1-like protein 4 [Amaranthus tricolor]|uniref:TORTIFOLIA1-like protein 4 n=1 Tax=Amaranthus tricolor TaxID=29722 RepID=UPI00258F495F|nr:TORTIFOLIA1-like protein 4 [Amaranthus tricolor]
MSSFQKPTTIHEIRQKLCTNIDKLSDRSTFSQASSELNYLAKTLPLDFLPTFLSSILSIDSSSKSPVKVHGINLLSLLSNTHKSFLSPHIQKIIPFFLKRLRDSDSSVRNACISAVSSLSSLNYVPLLDSFLGSISIEQDLNAQMGCCLCLKAAINGRNLEEREEGDLRKRVLPKVMKLLKKDGFKAKGALLGVIESIIGVNNGIVINGKVGGNLVGNVVGITVDMLSSDDWMARKSAAEVLLKLGVVLDEDAAAQVKNFVVNSLESRRFDKVKVTREIMNQALEAWKEVQPGGPDQQNVLSRSNSPISKDNVTCGASTSIPRRFSYAGYETPKPKKTMAKCRSSLSDVSSITFSPSMSPSPQDSFGFETPQRKETLSKTKSSLSDDSSITDDSSLVSKSSYDHGFEVSQSKKPMSKRKSSLPVKKKSYSKKNDKKSSAYESLDWKVEIAVPQSLSEKAVSEDDANSLEKTSEERVLRFNASKAGSCVIPLVEKDEPREGLAIEGGGNEEVGESNADSEDLTLIRKQLIQIERQQSDLLVLIQRFMGNSQSGIDSLETRVTGLERALDEISHDLAMQSGRITNNDSTASSCCPSTEFLSPKFWRRTEGKSSNLKSSHSGSVPNKEAKFDTTPMDGYTLHEQQSEGIYRESWGSVKGIGQSVPRGRNCSPRSFDSASTATCITSVGRGV